MSSSSRSERPKFPAFNSSYDDTLKKTFHTGVEDRFYDHTHRGTFSHFNPSSPPRMPELRKFSKYPKMHSQHPSSRHPDLIRSHMSGHSPTYYEPDHSIRKSNYDLHELDNVSIQCPVPPHNNIQDNLASSIDQQDNLFDNYNSKKSNNFHHESTNSAKKFKQRKITHVPGESHIEDKVVIQVQSRKTLTPPPIEKNPPQSSRFRTTCIEENHNSLQYKSYNNKCQTTQPVRASVSHLHDDYEQIRQHSYSNRDYRRKPMLYKEHSPNDHYMHRRDDQRMQRNQEARFMHCVDMPRERDVRYYDYDDRRDQERYVRFDHGISRSYERDLRRDHTNYKPVARDLCYDHDSSRTQNRNVKLEHERLSYPEKGDEILFHREYSKDYYERRHQTEQKYNVPNQGTNLPVLRYEKGHVQDKEWPARPPPPLEKYGANNDPEKNSCYIESQTSEFVENVIHEALKSHKVQETLEATKTFISSIIPSNVEEDDVAILPQDNTILPKNVRSQQKKLENTACSSEMVHNHEKHSLHPKIPQEPPKSKFANAFSKTAAMYASKWSTDNKHTIMVTDSQISKPVGDTAYSADFHITRERMIDLSSELQICFEDITTKDQLDLLFRYFHGKRTLRQLFYKLPLRVSKFYTPTADEENTDNVVSLLVNKAPIYFKKEDKPETEEGSLDCSSCKKFNLNKAEYQEHVNTDLHIIISNRETWFKKLYAMPKLLPKYSLIFCIPCNLYFMNNFNGGTIVGHGTSKAHEMNLSYWRLKFPQCHTPPTFCMLTSLRTTPVCMPSPSECKYLKPREAFDSYRAVYEKMMEKGLVTDA